MPETHCIHCNLQPQPCRSSFAKILEQCPSGVIVIDANGMVRFVNDAAEKLFGRPVWDLLGASGDFLFPEGGELLFQRQDGSAVVAEIQQVETEWGGETAQLVYLRDVSDRKRTEDALKAAILKLEEENAKSEAIIAAIGDGISIQDTVFKIIYQNQIH